MPTISGLVRSHNGQFVRHLCQLRKSGTEGNARNLGWDLTGNATIFRRCRHFRIEKFDMRRPSLQEEQHHGFVFKWFAFSQGFRLGLKQAGQRKTSQTQCPCSQKIPATKSCASLIKLIVCNGKHITTYIDLGYSSNRLMLLRQTFARTSLMLSC